MGRDTVLPHGEALRRALRWLSDERRHDAAAIEEAARCFDLSPAEEEFLLRHCREGAASMRVKRQPLGDHADESQGAEE